MSDYLDLKTAFYPCCGNDLKDPCRILRGHAERVIFCDNDPAQEVRYFEQKPRLERSRLLTRFICGDTVDVIKLMRRIDVLFYRCDSGGEGGSGIAILGKDYLGEVLTRMPLQGGVIITDGSNNRNGVFRKMMRPSGLELCGWIVRLADQQPFAGKERGYGPLYVFRAEPVGDDSGNLPRHFDHQEIYF